MGKKSKESSRGPGDADNASNGNVTSSTIVSHKESASAAALRALKALSKSTSAALRMDDVPYELLIGERVDLHRWTLLMSDKNLQTLSKSPNEYCHLDGSQGEVPRMFDTYWKRQIATEGLQYLNISGAKEVTDYGITLVARKSPNLKELNITDCIKISDAGLREVGMLCPKINALIMSGCHGIEGGGLIAFAECCRFLIKLNVSRCKSLQKFSIAKLFFECKRLEEVDISHMREVGDEEIRALALNCPNMMYFNAKDSPYISDQSILALSQNCQDLDFVDVSRDKLTFRISDVSLLALGEKSKSLRVLRFSGCDQVTDVGLTWLAEGCHVLEELDMANCNRITDAGLRSIGASCHALTSINFSNAKLCTDVGLASISTGCPKLKKVNAHGLFLLSDPRLNAPQKGQKLEAWQAVVGVAALSKSCPELESMDLSGCFRLNQAFAGYVPNLTNLKCLTLVGCNQSTPESFAAIAHGCRKIQEINFSDCGKAVNHLSISAFAANCPLRVVILHRCDGVKGGVMKALSTCDTLEKIDVSYSRFLTDIMVLPITEAGKVMNLKTVIFIGCELVTDTSLAWLASKTQNIMTLSAKGSRMSRASVQAVKDRFPFSDMVATDSFLGFVPKHRIEDQKLINAFFIVRDGIIRLQARQRAYLAKVRVSGLAERRRRKRAIRVLQAMCRLFIAKNRVYYRRKQVKRINHCAVVLTSIFWMCIAHAKVRRRKLELYALFKVKMAIMIQLCWRKHRDYGRLLKLREEYRLYMVKCNFGATKMQSIVRMYFSKYRVLHVKQMKAARIALEHRKATEISRVYRGHLGRLRAHAAREERYRIQVLMARASKKVQYAYRAHRTRCIVNERANYRSLRRRMCIKIQSVMRGALARLKTAEKLFEIHEAKINGAALKIQCRIRIKLARLAVAKMFEEANNILIQQNAAATVLQKYVRGNLARILLVKLKEEARLAMLRLVQLEMWAVVKIQSFVRGTWGRRRFDDLLRQKKGKWKELFDEDKQRRFFYNQLTGEIRWRMPQDLLDLIPNPTCDNCSQCKAEFECAVCNEIFCPHCFEAVHYGGRRRDHEFRTLFDYYGKRLDYGDGEFPCKWPSEVLQDEVQGWMLRVAPLREQTAQYGAWEEYKDVESNGAAGRTFYFNRETFETTYDMPHDVALVVGTGTYTHSQDQGQYTSTYNYATGQWEESWDGNQASLQNGDYDYSSQGYYDSAGVWHWYSQDGGNTEWGQHQQQALEYQSKQPSSRTGRKTSDVSAYSSATGRSNADVSRGESHSSRRRSNVSDDMDRASTGESDRGGKRKKGGSKKRNSTASAQSDLSRISSAEGLESYKKKPSIVKRSMSSQNMLTRTQSDAGMASTASDVPPPNANAGVGMESES